MKKTSKRSLKNTTGTKMHTFKAIDLFAGIGGFRIAAERSGIKIVFSSDIDEFAKKTYAENFGETPSGDITKIDVHSIPNFDILMAGFPCQPFSYAGKNEGFSDRVRGTLFFEIIRILNHHQPAMFLLENVKGLKSHDKGNTLQVIMCALRQLGYQVHLKMLNSIDFGVPQSRERLYFVGFKGNIDFSFPTGSRRKTTLRDIVDVNNRDPSLLLPQFDRDRIDFHFKCTNGKGDKRKRVEHCSAKYAAHSKKGRYGVYSYLKPDNNLRFHIGDVAKTQIQEAYYTYLDGIAPAIIANRMPKMWDLKRKLSVEECKLLQGFPKDFVFPVSNAQAYKQIGNSVTINVIEEIIGNMKKAYLKFLSQDTAN